MIICVLKQIYTRKKSFLSKFLNPQFFLTVHCSCHGQSRIAVKWRRKGHEKCILETPHNELKCILASKESKFNEKRIKIFTLAFMKIFFLWNNKTIFWQEPFTAEAAFFLSSVLLLPFYNETYFSGCVYNMHIFLWWEPHSATPQIQNGWVNYLQLKTFSIFRKKTRLNPTCG